MEVKYLFVEHQRNDARKRKQNTKNNRSVKQDFFRAAASVEGSAKIVAAKRAAERCTCLLEQDTANKQERKHYLDIGQNAAQSHY